MNTPHHLASPDLRHKLISAQPQQSTQQDARPMVALTAVISEVRAPRRKVAASRAETPAQGYSLRIREDLAAFTGPPQEPEQHSATSTVAGGPATLWSKQRADRSRSHQHASSSGRHSSPAGSRRRPDAPSASKRSALPSRSTGPASPPKPGNSKRELFRRSAAARGQPTQQRPAEV